MMDIRAAFPPVVSAFMQSDARIRHIMGPFRSGKSSGSVVEIVRRSIMQKIGTDGYRRSRWMIVRNTMKELKDTTLKTWLAWFPSGGIGYWKETGATYFIEPKDSDVRAEVMFRALDRPEDAQNLLSLEITGAYFNEVREIDREILQKVDGRIGQFPSMKDGGPSWYGIWADTNPPEEGSYLHRMYEGLDPDDGKTKKPNGWEIFRQPAAVRKGGDGIWATNPEAENLGNLIPGYYQNQLVDKTDEYIRVNLGAEYGRSKGGKPVHPMFNRDIHVAKLPLRPDKNNLLLISADFGHTPAIVLKQQNAFGQVLALDEIVTFGMDIERAIEEKLLPLMRRKYDGFDCFVTGDPSGSTGSDADSTSCADIFRRYSRKGLGKVKLAWSNSPVHRQGATDHFLARLGDHGRPVYQVDPGCEWLIQALSGKFCFKKFKDGRESSEVDKNDWSHVGDANSYADMYFERGGRRKAELKERGPAPAAEPNAYVSPR